KVEAVKKEETRFSFRIGGQDVVAALMPAPIPWSDLEWPCKTSWLWKDAANVLRSHTNHLIVTVIGEGALLRTRLLTQVTASILATCPQAVGVYWTDAAMVIQPSLFRKFATKILPDGLPLYIWVNFQVGKAASGKAH